MIQRECARSSTLQRHYMQHHARWRTIWFCPLPGCPASSPNKEGLVRHLQSKQHAKGVDLFRAHTLAKQVVHQNCFWPMNQTFADKLLRASKRLLRYVTLYSMAGVAIEGRVFCIPSSALDTAFIDACMCGIPDTKDDTQSSAPEWLQPAPINSQFQKDLARQTSLRRTPSPTLRPCRWPS